MRIMRKSIAMIAALCGAVAFGQTPLDCIDPDLLRALLLWQGDSFATVSTTVPPELSGFKAPAQFTWLGASERGMGVNSQTAVMVSAAYRTNLAPDAASTAAGSALVAGGWKPNEQSGLSMMVFARQGLSSRQYCQGSRQISISSNRIDSVTYVVFGLSRFPENSGFSTSCSQSSLRPPERGAELDPYMPTLDLPRDPASGKPARQLGGGGSGGEIRQSDTRFKIKDSTANVASHFARQLARQGWVADASWSGPTTVGNSWTRNAGADLSLRATLIVMATGDGEFSVSFSAVKTR